MSHLRASGVQRPRQLTVSVCRSRQPHEAQTHVLGFLQEEARGAGISAPNIPYKELQGVYYALDAIVFDELVTATSGKLCGNPLRLGR